MKSHLTSAFAKLGVSSRAQASALLLDPDVLWLFTAVDGNTRLEQHGEMKPKGPGWLAAPLMPLIVRRNLHDTAVALKRELERTD